MGKKTVDQDYVDSAEEEGRSGYDLRARLRGANKLTQEITVYTDEVAGKELGGSEDELSPYGVKVGTRRWGIKGDLEELSERLDALRGQDNPDAEELAEIQSEVAKAAAKLPALLKKLDESALVFTLKSVPELIVRDTRRKAKRAAGIKGKKIEGFEEEYALEYTPLLLVASVVSWKDKASGEEFSTLAVEEAKALADELPAGEFAKLDAAMIELSFKSHIGKQATDSADF